MKNTDLAVAKMLHNEWMKEKDPFMKDVLWDFMWETLKGHFNGDLHKVSYVSDLILLKHLDEQYGGSHLKDVCKYHCMAARDF